MNEIDSKLEGMITGGVTHVVAKLIFFLIAQRRKQCDGRGELIVAVGFETGDRKGRGTEGKCQRKTQSGISLLSQMQSAGVKHGGAQPCRAKYIRVAEHRFDNNCCE